jgi:hypothetical protein
MTLLGVRIAGVAIGLLALVFVIVERRQVRAALRTFFLEPSSAFNLGALRIVLFGLVLDQARNADAAWFAGLPPGLRMLPPGWQWLNGDAFFDPTFAGRAQDALIVASACAALGLFTRASAPIAALLSLYVLGMQNFFVKINHSNHATVLCALVLACSPCGDALSIDRLWKRLRGYAAPPLAVAYTVPVRCCWMLLGTVYLFPGLWKLFESGDLWLSGEKVKAEMYSRWAEKAQFEPFVRIDEHPGLLALLGLATLLFEIGFFFALFGRATRVVAAFSAVGFHLGVAYFMGIRFHVYLPLVLLFDAPQLGERVRSWLPASIGRSVDASAAVLDAWTARQRSRFAWAANVRPFPRRSLWPGTSAGALLVSAQLVAGVVPIVSWPISIHPRFSEPRKASTNIRKIRVVFEPTAGEATDLGPRLERLGSARFARLLLDLKQVKANELHQQGQTIVRLFRDSGVVVQPGDRVAVYRTREKLFPLGQHTDHHETLAHRYEITADYAVEVVE